MCPKCPSFTWLCTHLAASDHSRLCPLSLSLRIQVDRILGCGSALERNPVLQKHVKEVFSLPLLLTAADAAKGAALASLQQLPVTQHDTHQQTHVHIAWYTPTTPRIAWYTPTHTHTHNTHVQSALDVLFFTSHFHFKSYIWSQFKTCIYIICTCTSIQKIPGCFCMLPSYTRMHLYNTLISKICSTCNTMR